MHYYANTFVVCLGERQVWPFPKQRKLYQNPEVKALFVLLAARLSSETRS